VWQIRPDRVPFALLTDFGPRFATPWTDPSLGSDKSDGIRDCGAKLNIVADGQTAEATW